MTKFQFFLIDLIGQTLIRMEVLEQILFLIGILSGTITTPEAQLLLDSPRVDAGRKTVYF